MTRTLFIDTSGWCAVYDRSDTNHQKALAFWREITGTTGTLFTSDYVLDETLTLLRLRLGHRDAVEFGRAVLASEVVKVVPVSAKTWQEAWELFVKFRDKDFSFTDCTSFVLMRRLKLTEALAFDQHFRQMGFVMRPE